MTAFALPEFKMLSPSVVPPSVVLSSMLFPALVESSSELSGFNEFSTVLPEPMELSPMLPKSVGLFVGVLVGVLVGARIDGCSSASVSDAINTTEFSDTTSSDTSTGWESLELEHPANSIILKINTDLMGVVKDLVGFIKKSPISAIEELGSFTINDGP